MGEQKRLRAKRKHRKCLSHTAQDQSGVSKMKHEMVLRANQRLQCSQDLCNVCCSFYCIRIMKYKVLTMFMNVGIKEKKRGK